jgi:hypothetical protein
MMGSDSSGAAVFIAHSEGLELRCRTLSAAVQTASRRTSPAASAEVVRVVQYDKVRFILDPTAEARDAIGERVTLIDYPDGRLANRYKDADLPYRTFDKIRHVK